MVSVARNVSPRGVDRLNPADLPGSEIAYRCPSRLSGTPQEQLTTAADVDAVFVHPDGMAVLIGAFEDGGPGLAEVVGAVELFPSQGIEDIFMEGQAAPIMDPIPGWGVQLIGKSLSQGADDQYGSSRIADQGIPCGEKEGGGLVSLKYLSE